MLRGFALSRQGLARLRRAKDLGSFVENYLNQASAAGEAKREGSEDCLPPMQGTLSGERYPRAPV